MTRRRLAKRAAGAAVLGCLAAVVPGATLAAHSGAMSHVTLNVVKPYKAMAEWKHAMASATLTYTKGDITIKLTAENLPMPSALHAHVYVLFAEDGNMWDRVGVLHTSGSMSTVTGTVMMSKVTDLYVYAQAMSTKHPSGTQVLAAMV